jgi:hypothetical protein
MSWLITVLSRGGRVLVVAITTLPLLLFVILSSPAWIVWPFLDAGRRKAVHGMVELLTQWTRDVLHYATPANAYADDQPYSPATAIEHRPDTTDVESSPHAADVPRRIA